MKGRAGSALPADMLASIDATRYERRGMAAVALPTAVESNANAVVGGRGPLHIPSLDGLRALSFFIVFAAHAGLERIVPGGFGVTVFFFLSGYLITTLMRVESDTKGHVSLKHFYLRRALRILPPFYIVLFAANALGVAGILRSDVRPQALPVLAQVLHFSNYWIAMRGWSGVAAGTGVYWSLAVEEHFYLVFPTVFLALERLHFTGRQKALAFWGVCGAVFVWRCVLVRLLHAGVDRTYLCSDTRFDSIAFGCALAVWNNPVLDRNIRPSFAALRWRYLAVLAATGLLLVTFVVRGQVFRETLRYTLQGLALTPIFFAAIRWPGWSIFRPLNYKPMRFVGTLSYSLYLIHQVALAAVDQHLRLGRVAGAFVALLVSLALAFAMYRVVEKPCAKLRRRLSATDS
jgi:peptidoglycan/LPS O-acetylase OafA/YrhL